MRDRSPVTHQLFLGDAAALAAASVGGVVTLEGDEGRHAATVVRVRPGERYLVADGAGRRVLCEAEVVERARVRGRVLDLTDEPAPQPRLVLVQALAKGDRDEQAIEAATELGVDEVVPWQAERSIVVWRDERAAKSLAKWAAVVARATKQSRRARMPLTSSVADLPALVARARDSALVGRAARGRDRAAGRCRPARRGRRARRRRARGRHLAARARRPRGGWWATGAARSDDPPLVVSRPRRARGDQRRHPLALTGTHPLPARSSRCRCRHGTVGCRGVQREREGGGVSGL